jgi:L-cysteine desulfidase
MEKLDSRYTDCLKILHEELLSAMGCTEPIAIAYAAAAARDTLGVLPEKVWVEASGNIFKNVKSVIVPNTNGLKGIKAAAAAGIVAGDTSKKLEVLSAVSDAQKEAIRAYCQKVEIRECLADTTLIFDLILTVQAGTDSAKVRIANHHTNIVLIEKNGETLFSREIAETDSEGALTDRSVLNVEMILEFANSVEIGDVREVLDRQITSNMAIAEEGLRGDYGANIGSVLLDANGDSVRTRARAMAAAGSDARMSGCEMPVTINSGSGNQGITASVPVIVYAREYGVPQEKLYRALVLSNLIAIHQKTGIGRLSAYCGAISAGAAAGCGIAYLLNGSYDSIKHTLVNALAVTSGIICDGAKPSCAAKISEAVDAGLMGYEMYCRGQEFLGGDGIVKKGVERTITNVGCLARRGMRQTDQEILHIMIDD